MKNVFAETFKGGQVIVAVTSLTLVNNTTKTEDFTVPDDCVYELISIKVTNPDDVARNVDMNLYKESAKTNFIGKLLTNANLGAGSYIQWPGGDSNWETSIFTGVIMGAGETLSVTWAAGGASTGATDADGMVIKYRKLSRT